MRKEEFNLEMYKMGFMEQVYTIDTKLKTTNSLKKELNRLVKDLFKKYNRITIRVQVTLSK